MEEFLDYYRTLMAAPTARQWHDHYKEFFNLVQGIRNRLREGHLDPENPDDYTFLKRLLFDDDNGVANRGQLPMSEEDLRLLVRNEDFMEALESFIRTPSSTCFTAFRQSWDRFLLRRNGRHAYLLANRTAAACTTDVSTTPSLANFDQAIYLLNVLHPVPGPAQYRGRDEDWFAKNVFLVRKINETLDNAGLDRNDDLYDAFSVSIFPWAVLAHEQGDD